MKRYFLITLISTILASSAFATTPKPFTCDSKSFVSFNTSSSAGSGDSKFDTISLLDGKITANEVVTGVYGVNSIGYNVKDNMVWGYNLGSNKVVRIDADKKSTSYNISGLDQRFYVAADVDKNGILYLFSRGNATERKHIARVQLGSTPTALSEVLLVDENNDNNAYEINTADFAFNPKDDKLYFIQKSTDTLYSITFTSDGSKGLVHREGSLMLGSVDPIINFFDKDGNFYFNKDTTNMYKVNVGSSSKATSFSKLNKALRNGDGARCANASVEEPIPEQDPFSCESSGTVVSYVTGGTASSGVSNLALISIADGEITSSSQFASDTAIGVNSIGYNVKDDYIWGYNIPKRKIVRIGADNSINYYEMDHEPNIKGNYYNTADVSPDGVLYMKCDSYTSRLDRVELNGANRTQKVLPSITLNKPINTADFAFNPRDGKIYFVDYDKSKFMRIDIVGTVGTINEVADVPGRPYTVIAAFDVDGNFYYNSGEDINKIEFTSSGIHITEGFSEIKNLTQGDGARCANAPMPEDELVAFTCDDTMYFSNAYDLSSDVKENGYMFLHSINREQSPFTFNKIGEGYHVDGANDNSYYNALAYNPEDNFLYATVKNKLLKIDKNGVVKELGVIDGLPDIQHFAGTFGHVEADGSAYYYLTQMHNREIYKIDVKTKTIKDTIVMDEAIYTVDMTIDESGENLYFMQRPIFNAPSPNQLMKLNIATKTVTSIGDAVEGESLVGSTFCDSSGHVYAIYDEGGVYEIDTITGERKPISDAPMMANLNDGAMCPGATVNLRRTLTISDANITEGDIGEKDLEFVVKWNQPSSVINKGISFKYQVFDGNSSVSEVNAISPEDFTRSDIPTTVAMENSEYRIKVPVKGDTIVEKDEKLSVVITEVSGALLSPDYIAVGTIINDDEPVAFECDQNSYIFSSGKNETFSNSYIVDLIDKKITLEEEKFGTYHLNAIGFNPVDGFIYGWQSDAGSGDYDRPNAHLVKVDANYEVYDVNLTTPIPNSTQRYILGDVSKDGIFYMANMGGDDSGYYLHKIRVIDLNKTEFVKDIDIVYQHTYPDNKPEYIRNADFAINPIDNNLYMVNSNNNQLIKIYLNGEKAGEFEEMGEVYAMNSNFDIDKGNTKNTYSVFDFFDKNGNFYFQIGEKIYKIDISEPWSGSNNTKAKAVVFSNINLTQSGDGARCSSSSMGDKPIISISVEDTLEGNDGVSDVNITFKSDRVLEEDISITYSTFVLDNVSKNATSVVDFKAGSRIITIAKDATSISIPVVIGDIDVESDEQFGIKLESDDVLFLDGDVGVGEDISIVATIKDDDYSKLNAYDVNDDVAKQIKTKIVEAPFTLDIVAISPDGETIIDFSEDMNKTKIKLVDSSECVTDIEDLNKSGFVELGELPEEGRLQKNFVSNLALKDVKVQFWWENKFGEQTVCSSDNFAIRPKTFSFGVGISTQSVVKAGEDFNLTIKALDQNDSNSLNYDEQPSSFKIDFDQKNYHCDFHNTDLSVEGDDGFNDGVLKLNINYKDVGVLDINISEIDGEEFAKVDIDDTPNKDERLIQKAHREIRFIPDRFDVNSTVINNMTKESSGYAFYSNHIDKSPMWNINVTAVNKEGDTTINYNNECAANNINIIAKIDINTTATLLNPLKLQYSEDDATSFSEYGDIIGDIGVEQSLNIYKSSFKDGFADKNITINFQRSKLVEQEPATINFIKAKAVDTNVTGEHTLNKALTYKYMRAYIQSPIEVIGSKELNTTVYYEAYDPYGSGKRTVSGDRGWKVVSFDDTSKKMKFENLHVAYGDRVIAINDSNITLNVNAISTPEKNKITMTLDPDFRYITDTISTEVSFTPDSANWAGDGSLGMMVDTNVSRRTKFKRMQW